MNQLLFILQSIPYNNGVSDDPDRKRALMTFDAQNKSVLQNGSTQPDVVANSTSLKPYRKPELIVHGDMRAITRSIVGGEFDDGVFTTSIDPTPFPS
jgi:hypothetical protein